MLQSKFPSIHIYPEFYLANVRLSLEKRKETKAYVTYIY